MERLLVNFKKTILFCVYIGSLTSSILSLITLSENFFDNEFALIHPRSPLLEADEEIL